MFNQSVRTNCLWTCLNNHRTKQCPRFLVYADSALIKASPADGPCNSHTTLLDSSGLLLIEPDPVERLPLRPWRPFPDPPPVYAQTVFCPSGRSGSTEKTDHGRICCLEVWVSLSLDCMHARFTMCSGTHCVRTHGAFCAGLHF
jgi:hypothetical protein